MVGSGSPGPETREPPVTSHHRRLGDEGGIVQDQDNTPLPICQDLMGSEMHDLCARYLSEAANLPDPINSCPLHPDALPAERTMNGRRGCVGCVVSPFNLDAQEIEDGPLRP